MRPLAFLFGLLLGACAAPARPTPATLAASTLYDVPPIEDSLAATVALVTPGESTPWRTQCAGVWVSDTSILTAAHCVPTPQESNASVPYATRSDLAGGAVTTPRLARLYVRDVAHDLALLRTTGASPHRHVVLGQDPAIGQPVYKVGHPFGLTYSYAAGHVSAMRGPMADIGGPYVQASVPTNPGDSGGGLFAYDGSLVGVTHGIIRGATGIGLYVGLEPIRALLAYAGPAL